MGLAAMMRLVIEQMGEYFPPTLPLRRAIQHSIVQKFLEGRLCQALGVTNAHNDVSVTEPPFTLIRGEASPLAAGPRIGITKATDRLWRFGEAGSPYLSRRFPH